MREGKVLMTVTDQRIIANFFRGGAERTLYAVKAVDENGIPVEEELRSFAELPVGEAMEFDVNRYVDERHGESWTITKPRENSARRIAALEKQVSDLADRLSALERRVG